MPNKTIYVSEKDEKVFEEAQKLGNDALSAVIVRALKDFVARNQTKQDGLKEIKIGVGDHGSERQQRFVGRQLGKWSGLSDDKELLLRAAIYQTQKNNWAVHLVTMGKASLLVHGTKDWTEWMDNPRHSKLIVASDLKELKPQLPKSLYEYVASLAARDEAEEEYLDI